MNTIIYTKETEGSQARLRLVPDSVNQKDCAEVFHSMKGLAYRLLKDGYDSAEIIVDGKKREDLFDLTPLLRLLRKVKIILVVPDRKPKAIAIEYQLEPRYECGVNIEFAKIYDVFEKIIMGLSSQTFCYS
jgi:hypothetical protein